MKFKAIGLLFIVLSAAMHAQVKATVSRAPTAKKAVSAPKNNEGIFAEIQTAKGNILLQLEYVKTPITVASFISLAEGTNTFVSNPKLVGKPFFDGLKFHRVISNFMIQGGDPLGNGTGDPGFKFKDEFAADLKHDKGGILSMANSGPGTNGSQFFITHTATPHLDNKHSVFGHVVSGMEVVNAIVQDDVIIKIVIIRKGAAAKAFDAAKVFSAYYSNKAAEDQKQIAAAQEQRKKIAEAELEKKRAYTRQYANVIANKMSEFAKLKAASTQSATGLQYVIKKGNGKQPTDLAPIYIHYAGYLEDGTLFDSSYEEVNKAFGKWDQARAAQNGYQPFPFKYGSKSGLIPGFLEGVNMMSFGDKATLFIPANLGYGAKGAGGIIPPNANLIFEVELVETLPQK